MNISVIPESIESVKVNDRVRNRRRKPGLSNSYYVVPGMCVKVKLDDIEMGPQRVCIEAAAA